MPKVIAALALLLALAACTHDQPAPARAPHPSPSVPLACEKASAFGEIIWQDERDMEAEKLATEGTTGTDFLDHRAAVRALAAEISELQSMQNDLEAQCNTETRTK